MIEVETEHAGILEKVNKVLRKDYKNKSFLKTIEALVDHIEKVDREFISVSQSVDEDDAIISSLQEELRFKNEVIDKMESHLVRNGKEIITKENERAELEFQLQQANKRIKELESLPQKMEKLHIEQRLVKASYMDLDD
ncbi:MAG: hypothetical protein K0S80_5309 [Neobacillus sp.]|nr:hypothetical protein [Neobacillus sp.]